MRTFRMLLPVAFVASVIALSPGAVADQLASPPFRVIVNPRNPIGSVDHKFLLDLFLRKRTRWPDQQPVVPVDLPTNSPTRQRFSSEALKRSVSAVKGYWLQVIFSGHGVPPPELDGDEQVVRFVARTPGAIGYVSGTVTLDGAKVISVE